MAKGKAQAPGRTTKRARKKGSAAQSLDEYGIAAIVEDIYSQMSMTQIARARGVSTGKLLAWIEADDDRSAHAREARRVMGKTWDEAAEAVIRDARGPFQLSKARELAHHYRWRAKMIAPHEYSETVKQEHSGPQGAPIPVAIAHDINLEGATAAELKALKPLLERLAAQKGDDPEQV